VLRFRLRLMVKCGPLMRPQASEIWPFWNPGRSVSFDVPDEVLERVAAEQKAFTVVYCTNPWYDCGLPQ
jgi:hypothetical protein